MFTCFSLCQIYDVPAFWCFWQKYGKLCFTIKISTQLKCTNKVLLWGFFSGCSYCQNQIVNRMSAKSQIQVFRFNNPLLLKCICTRRVGRNTLWYFFEATGTCSSSKKSEAQTLTFRTFCVSGMTDLMRSVAFYVLFFVTESRSVDTLGLDMYETKEIQAGM